MGSDLDNVAGEAARSGFFLVSGSLVATVILSIGTILCGRLLGAEFYGQYTLILVGPQLLFLFTDLGINQGIIKLTANLRSKEEGFRVPRIIYCGLFMRVITGSLMSLILFVFAEDVATLLLNRADFSPYVRMMSMLILFQAIYTTSYSSFVSLDKAEFSALTLNLEAIMKSALSIILVLLGFSVFGALLGNIISYAIAGIFGVMILRILLSKKDEVAPKISYKNILKTELKGLIYYGLPIFVAFLLAGFIPLYQNIVIAHFSTDVAIGNFKAAANFATTLTMLSVPITTALLSGFSKIDSAEQQRKMFFKTANKFTTLIVFPFVALFVIFSSEIVQFIYGSTYQSASFFLALNVLLYLLVGFGYLNLVSFYNGIGETKMTLKIGLITFALVAVLSPISAIVYGVPGLIGSYLLANAVGTFYGAYIGKRKYSLQFDISSVTKIGLVAVLCSLPCILLRFTGFQMHYVLFVGVFVYLAAYLILVPLTRIVSKAELEMLKNIFEKIGPLRIIGNLALKFERRILQFSLSIKNQRE